MFQTTALIRFNCCMMPTTPHGHGGTNIKASTIVDTGNRCARCNYFLFVPRISSTRKELLKAACRQKSALRLVNTQVAQYRSGTLTQPRAVLYVIMSMRSKLNAEMMMTASDFTLSLPNPMHKFGNKRR